MHVVENNPVHLVAVRVNPVGEVHPEDVQNIEENPGHSGLSSGLLGKRHSPNCVTSYCILHRSFSRLSRPIMSSNEIRMAVLADQDPIPQDTLDEDLDVLRDAARLIYPGVGSMLYDWWETINEAHFGRQMTPPGIQFGLTPHGKNYGAWRGYENTITLHRSLLDPSGDAWGKRHLLGNRFAWDVLLHEMIHQYIDTVRGIGGTEARINSPQGGNEADGGSPHNCPSWVAEINRLSAEIGLDCTAHVVKQRRVNGDVKWAPPEGFDMSIGDISSWPHSVRPDGYYRNDPNPAFELDERSEPTGDSQHDQDDLDEVEQQLEEDLNQML